MANKKALFCYHDWLEPLRKISQNDFKTFVIAMIEYDAFGKEPPKFKGAAGVAADFIFPQIARAKKNSEAQSKRKSKVDQESTEGKPKVDQESTEGLVYTNTITETNTKTNTKKKTKRKVDIPTNKYGQYGNVVLSDLDLEKLRQEFPNDYQDRIERLSEYMASTGKKYKNHLATIRAWARKDEGKKQAQKDEETSNPFLRWLDEHGEEI